MAWSSRLVYLGMFKDGRAVNRGWPAKIKGWLAWVTWPKVLLLVAFIEGLWFVVFLKLIKFDKCLKFIKTPIYPEAMALSSCQGWSVGLTPEWLCPFDVGCSVSSVETASAKHCSLPAWGSVLSFSCVTCCPYLLSKAGGICRHFCLPVSFMSFDLTWVETWSSQLSLHIHLRSCHITTCSIFFLSFTH